MLLRKNERIFYNECHQMSTDNNLHVSNVQNVTFWKILAQKCMWKAFLFATKNPLNLFFMYDLILCLAAMKLFKWCFFVQPRYKVLVYGKIYKFIYSWTQKALFCSYLRNSTSLLSSLCCLCITFSMIARSEAVKWERSGLPSGPVFSPSTSPVDRPDAPPDG